MAVEDTGGPLKTPVGKTILRECSTFGNAIDHLPPPADVECGRTIHRNPPPLASQTNFVNGKS